MSKPLGHQGGPRPASSPWRPQAAVLVLSGLMALAAGCSGFGREWRAAGRPEAASSGMEGRWDGSWRSDSNGHHGSLRCVIQRGDDQAYRARFRARYAGLLSFGYTVSLNATNQAPGHWRFSGGADLGRLAGGVYQYEGEVREDAFKSSYRSSGDHGVFEMNRVQR